VPWVARISASPGWHGSAQPGTAQEAVGAKPVRRLEHTAGDPTRPRTWSRRWRWPHSARSRSAAHRAHRPGAAWSLACPDRPGLRRSVPPVDRPQAEGVDADPFQVDPAGRTEFVQQHHLEPLEHPAQAHWSRCCQQVVAEPQPSSLAGSRLHGVEVRAMKMSAATRLRSGTRRGRRRESGPAVASATVGRAATARQEGVGRQRWPYRSIPPWLDRPKPSSRTVPDRPLNGAGQRRGPPA
jgi:hypothetical protein